MEGLLSSVKVYLCMPPCVHSEGPCAHSVVFGCLISHQGQKQRFRAREGGQGIMSLCCLVGLRVVEGCLEALCVTSPSS